MPKIQINSEDLPAIPTSQETYFVRVRVVSLDENRSSHWLYVEVPNPDYVT